MDFLPEDSESNYESDVNYGNIPLSYPEFIPSSFLSEVSEMPIRSGLSDLPSGISETPSYKKEVTPNSSNHSAKNQNYYRHSSYNDEMLDLAKQIASNKFAEDNAFPQDNNAHTSFWMTPTSKENSISGGSQPSRRKRNKRRKSLSDKPEFTGPSFFSDNEDTFMRTRTRIIKKTERYQSNIEEKNKKKPRIQINSDILLSSQKQNSQKKTLSGKSCKKLCTESSNLDNLNQQQSQNVNSAVSEVAINTFDKIKLSIPCSENTVRSGRIHFFSSTSSDNEDFEMNDRSHVSVLQRSCDSIQTQSSDDENKPKLKRNKRRKRNTSQTPKLMETNVEQPNPQIPCDSCKPAWEVCFLNMLNDLKLKINFCLDFCQDINDKLQVCDAIIEFIAAMKAKYDK